MQGSAPYTNIPSWFLGEEPLVVEAPAVGAARKRVPRHKHDEHPLIVAVRQLNNQLARVHEALLPRSLDEYVGILCTGIEAGDLLAPLNASQTSSRFHAVRAALRFAARAVEAKRPLLTAHGMDSLAVYGLDVENLVERTSRKGPKIVKAAKLQISLDEWANFGKAIEQLPQPLRDICTIVVQGDLRANDVLRITRQVAKTAVDCGQAITIQKGNRRRAWEVEPRVRLALARLLRNSSWTTLCDLVVRPGEFGNPPDEVRTIRTAYGRIYRTLSDLAKATGLNFHGTHTFRRALAVTLVTRRAPDRVIQASLGHANLSTTQIYTGGASPDEVEQFRSDVRSTVFDKKEGRET